MKEELFDNGILRVVVPNGWKLFNGMDSEGKPSVKKPHILKMHRSKPIFLQEPESQSVCLEKMRSIFHRKDFMMPKQKEVSYEEKINMGELSDVEAEQEPRYTIIQWYSIFRCIVPNAKRKS